MKTSITTVLCPGSSPRIMHKFAWWIDLNVIWQKPTPEVKRIWVLWIKCSVYTLLTGLLTCSSHDEGGWWNLPSTSQIAREQEAECRVAASSLLPFPCAACPPSASDSGGRAWARPRPGLLSQPSALSKTKFSITWYSCTCRLQSRNKVRWHLSLC